MRSMLLRDLRLFGRGVIPALVLTLVLAAGCALSSYAISRSEEGYTEPIRFALVDQEDSLLSRIAIHVVMDLPGIQVSLRIDRVDEETAREGIRSGDYVGAMILPDGFTDHVLHLEDFSVVLLLSEKASQAADLVAEIAHLGQTMITTGQYAILAGENEMLRSGIYGEKYNSLNDQMNDVLLDQAVSIENTSFIVETVPYAGTGLSAASWYALCWLTLLLLFTGLFFEALYTSDLKRPILSRLYAAGIRPHAFMAGKILWPFLFRAVLLLGVLAALSAFMPLSISFVSVLLAVTGLLFLTIVTSSLAVLLSRNGAWIFALLSMGAAGLLLTGGLIPRSMLPEFMTVIGDMTPSGAAAALFAPLFGGRPGVLPLIFAGLYAILLPLLALRRLQMIPAGGEVS